MVVEVLYLILNYGRFLSFGLFGFFFTTILLSIIFRLIDVLIDFDNSNLKVIYLLQIIGFISYPLSTIFDLWFRYFYSYRHVEN